MLYSPGLYFMETPAHLAALPNFAWLKHITPLTPEEVHQRENESRFDLPNSSYPLDVQASDDTARELWAVLAGSV